MCVSSRGWARQFFQRSGLVLTLLLASATSGVALAKTPPPLVDANPSVMLNQLPKEAQTTHRLIHSGGPFPFRKDGTVFGNRERLLPRAHRGYYREYTVITPQARNRGARRIVCGGEPPTSPENCYYTEDHYASFRRIVQ